MILTVTLNPAIDKILILDSFNMHKLHRLNPDEKSYVVAGGKGINIAQTLSKLGNKVIATGFAGGHSGHLLCDAMRQLGITTSFVFTNDSTRTNISILALNNETLTQINDFGQDIPEEDIRFFIENYEKLLTRVEYVVIAGSLPLGVSPEIYPELISMANKQNKKVVVHTVPQHMEIIMEEQPFLISPDMRSNHELFGKTIDGVEQFLETGKSIVDKCRNTEFVIFTHRLENVVAVTKKKGYVMRPKELRIVNMLGYGDSYLAGFIHAFKEKNDYKDILKYASAAGLTNVEDLYKEIKDVNTIDKNLTRINIEEINF